MRPLPVDSLKNFIRSLLGAASLAALLLAFTAAPASASACGQRVLDDWYDDGNVAATYPIHCYREAIADLPEDVQSYSSAEEDISAAMLKAIAAKERENNKDNGGTNDKNWIVVDNSGAPGHHKGRVYVVWDRVAPVVYDYCDHDCDKLGNWLPNLQTVSGLVFPGQGIGAYPLILKDGGQLPSLSQSWSQ